MDETDVMEAIEAPAGSHSGESSPSMPSAGEELRQDLRRKRVSEYHAATLEYDDPLRATLGSVNAGLMGIAVEMDCAIQRVLTTVDGSLEPVAQAAPSIELLTKVTRQIDRFAQLDHRLSSCD